MGRKDERGSLIIEASLVLVFYIMAILSLLYLFFFLRLQTKSQFALSQALLSQSDHMTMKQVMTDQIGDLYCYVTDHNLPFEEDFWTGSSAEQSFLGFFSPMTPKGLFETRLSNLEVEMKYEEPFLIGRLSYDLSWPGLFARLKSIHVSQQAMTTVWAYSSQSAHYDTIKEKKDKDQKEKKSIWQESPITRGKYFAKKMRDQAGSMAVKPGKGFDIYHRNHHLDQIISMNIFSKSYSKGEGDEASQYILRDSEIRKKLASHASKAIQQLEKYPSLQLVDGRTISLREGMHLRLTVVVPIEGKKFKKKLEELGQSLYKEKGVAIEFYYEEEAFPDAS